MTTARRVLIGTMTVVAIVAATIYPVAIALNASQFLGGLVAIPSWAAALLLLRDIGEGAEEVRRCRMEKEDLR